MITKLCILKKVNVSKQVRHSSVESKEIGFQGKSLYSQNSRKEQVTF